MSKYLLKIIGTDEIVNIVEWNGSGSLVAPTGYEFEPFSTDDTDFINYFETITVEDIPNISGNLFGQFTGELTGSVLFNGETFNELIHKTKYGELRLVSGSDIQRVSESYSMILSNDNIIMPLFNKIVSEEYTTNYQTIFNKVIDENISNYVISFKQKDNPNIVLDYLVHQTELTSSGDFSYYNISASLFGTASFMHETDEFFNSPDFLLTNWYVDFDLGERPQIGQFYGVFDGILKNRREIKIYYDSALNESIPTWANKITIIAIGGGGGGGAGGSGYAHREDFLKLWPGTIKTSPYVKNISSWFDYEMDGEKLGPSNPFGYSPYTPAVGYELVTGGGGGAGGCISISTFNRKQIPLRSKINVIVGSGGSGGKAISYFVNERQRKSQYRDTYNQLDKAWIGDHERRYEKDYNTIHRLFNLDKTINEFSGLWFGPYYCHLAVSNQANGKKGSWSAVELVGDRTLIKADGGYGGAAGIGLRTVYNLFHRFCVMVGKHNGPNYVAPGGGSSIGDSFGDQVRPGGHGGYGIAMPFFRTSYEKESKNTPDVVETINFFDDIHRTTIEPYKLNKAPDIPWVSKSNDSTGRFLPMGNTSVNMFEQYKTTSTLKPSRLAPPGGGGGCGASHIGLYNPLLTIELFDDTRDPNANQLRTFLKVDNAPDVFETSNFIRLPLNHQDVLQKITTAIDNHVVIGEGGKVRYKNRFLINETDSNGVEHKVEILDGANGGFIPYNFTDGTPTGAGIRIGYQLPTDISDKKLYHGQGGGGGAADYISDWYDTPQAAVKQDLQNNIGEAQYRSYSIEDPIPRGQNGGDGASGLVIIIYEREQPPPPTDQK